MKAPAPIPLRRAAVGLAVIAALALASILTAPIAVAQDQPAQPQTTLAELEDEVMCPVCGTLLGLSDAPQAERQRVLIRRLIDEGRSKEEIKNQLVDEYGPTVLALPEGSGFNLSAYLVPIAGFGLASIALLLAVRRWRRDTAAEESLGDQVGKPDGESGLITAEEERRLDADLARYDL